ncbi:MAG: ribonuclease HI family protein [Ardenticatenaceae bacterium]|nr:ribonuclease HI family protein [Ardenticatenaceae bacterium]
MMKKVSIHVDGAVSGTEYAGAAAIARTTEGFFQGWLSRQMPTMTNNEAEYHATLLGLKLAHMLKADVVEIVSDSEVVVRQMQGQSRVLSGRLKRLHQETCKRVGSFHTVTFRHVLREYNSLADALATEALLGRIVQMGPLPLGWLPLGRK